jgi:hypothetical protein
MGLESINLFDCAIGPFSFDNPVLAVIEHHTEEWSSCCLSDRHRYLPRALAWLMSITGEDKEHALSKDTTALRDYG